MMFPDEEPDYKVTHDFYLFELRPKTIGQTIKDYLNELHKVAEMSLGKDFTWGWSQEILGSYDKDDARIHVVFKAWKKKEGPVKR